MLLLVRTIVEAPNEGWGSIQTIAAFAISAALLGTFIAIERRTPTPLVRLGILRSASLVRANLGMMALFGAYVGFQFVMTLYLQSMNGWSSIETALAFLPAGLMVAVGSPRIGPLIDRIGAARLFVIGAAASVAGYALVLRVEAVPDYVGVFLPTILLIGIGFMILFPTLNIQATAGVAPHEQGLASGLVQTSFQVGGAIGLAITSAIVSARAGNSTDTGELIGAYQTAIVAALAIAALGLIAALSGLRRERRPELALEGAD
jgi:predicted MFS family arabinose efflux permease